MTLILDSGGVSGVAENLALLRRLRDRNLWPPQVPTVVLTESLTGDSRRDHAVNRFLRSCQIRAVDEPLARRAATLRHSARESRRVSAVDAIVAAYAESRPAPVVLTSDLKDLGALAAHTSQGLTVLAV